MLSGNKTALSHRKANKQMSAPSKLTGAKEEAKAWPDRSYWMLKCRKDKKKTNN